MSANAPTTTLDANFSSPEATPTPWEQGQHILEDAGTFWISTVRPDGRPHVTPLIAVWHDGAIYFCTGAGERKAKNLAANSNCILTTGTNDLNDGLDVVVEGEAVRVTDDDLLRRLAALWESKHGWKFDAHDGEFHHEAGSALVFEVAPVKAFGFGKGEPYSQTRWRF